jgi:hypothetical protein
VNICNGEIRKDRLEKTVVSFYKLTTPDYATDQQEAGANPVQQVIQYEMPGIRCSACGSVWGGYKRKYIEINDDNLESVLRGWPVDNITWNTIKNRLVSSAKVPASYIIEPGDILGRPIFEVYQPLVHDFIQAFPGQWLVSASVNQDLSAAAVTGITSVPVELRHSSTWQEERRELPEYFELLIHGHAWRVGSTEQSMTACNVCKRTIYPDPEWSQIDMERWDRSDVFTVDDNNNVAFVSDKFAELAKNRGYSNIALNAITPILAEPHNL